MHFICRHWFCLLILLTGLSYGLYAAERQPAQSSVQTLDLPDNLSPAYQLRVLPNPNSGRFRLEVDGDFSDTVQLVIINVEGVRVYEREIAQSGAFLFNLSTLRKGIYFAQIRTGSKVISCPILYAYDPEQLMLPSLDVAKP